MQSIDLGRAVLLRAGIQRELEILASAKPAAAILAEHDAYWTNPCGRIHRRSNSFYATRDDTVCTTAIASRRAPNPIP